MLEQLVYTSIWTHQNSKVVRPTGNVLQEIVSAARANNSKISITGLLIYNAGRFLQVLEGHPLVLNRLYAKIVADPRHTDIELLVRRDIHKRMFAQWQMALVNLEELHSFDLSTYSDLLEQIRYSTDDEAADHLIVKMLKLFSGQILPPDLVAAADHRQSWDDSFTQPEF